MATPQDPVVPAAPVLPRISDYVAWWAERTPDATALVQDGQRISYAALSRSVDALARALLAAGIAKGDRVATLQAPHAAFVPVFLATVSIGAIWVGLNPRYRLEEMAHVLRDSAPLLLFARSEIDGRDYAADLARLQQSTPSLQRIVTFAEDPPVAGGIAIDAFLQAGAAIADTDLHAARMAAGGRDPCLIVYTSGSTGTPKGALLHHQGIARFSVTQNRIWPVAPQVMVNYFPINHIGCLIDLTIPCLAAGGTMVMLPRFDPAACLELMARERVTVWCSVPSVFQMQLALPDFERHDLSAVQLIVWEGAAMPEELILRLRKICPRLATNYGMTETTSAITTLPPTDDFAALAHSVGTAFPGTEIRLVATDGSDAADGEPGEIWARSDNNLLGYWQQPQATADAITGDGFFRTGDLGIRQPDGSFRIVGRLKEMYKSGGHNVYPREVELALETHPLVALAAVVPVPDPVWQEVGIAYVTLCGDATEATLAEWCRQRLANYKLPKRIVIAAELPLLPIGKVDKVELRRRATEGA